MHPIDHAALSTVNRAIQLLEQDGWTQHTYRSDSGERCMAAAINDSLGPARTPSQRVHKRVQVAAGVVVRHERITWWNDRPGRTFQEVRQALLDTAQWIRDHQLDG